MSEVEKVDEQLVEVFVTGVSMSAYHRNVGIAEGLEQASEIIDETLKKLNEEDE